MRTLVLFVFVLGTAPSAFGQDAPRSLRAGLFDELEVLYPDSTVDRGSPERVTHTARGVPAGVHVLVTGLDPEGSLHLAVEEDVSFYRLIDVPVEENTGLGSRTEQFEGRTNPFVIRRAPFRVFEALEPVQDTLEVAGASTVALRLELDIAPGAELGEHPLTVTVAQGEREVTLVWTLFVHRAVVPPSGRDTLAYTNWFSPDVMAEVHGLAPWGEPFWEMLARYAALMARGRQNVIWVRWQDHFTDPDGDGEFALDRARLERWIATFRDAGLHFIEGAPIAGRPGGDWTSAALELRFGGLRGTSEAGRRCLQQLGAQLSAVLRDNGWRDVWLQHVADEPTDTNAADYVELAGVLRSALPGVRIIEATMSRAVVGGVDVWCPQVHEYQEARAFFDERRAQGDEVWVYTCLVPGGPWINRLLDQERLRPVYIGWAAERFGLQGFLHWGLNQYKADPFARSVVDHPAMPNTTNKLPAGDTHVIYPGPEGPWSGQRFEAHRIGLEDRELLVALRKRDPERAAARIARVFRAFDDYEGDVAKYRAVKRELLEALD